MSVVKRNGEEEWEEIDDVDTREIEYTNETMLKLSSFRGTNTLFLDVSTHLYKRLCPLVGPSVTSEFH